MSDINMTPLIDVMLVLLVIFLVTAPLMASSLRLELPRAEGAAPDAAPQAIALAVDAQGRVYLGDAPVSDAALRERLARTAAADPQAEVRLRADRSVPYGRIAELIGLVQAAGLARVGLVSEPAAAPAAAGPAR
ncbi:ExbD/TolR family protein [Piscinibacter sakaiensis]|nr:biopolymer transporter ExbD [Piscinibacter sakaiensis]